MRKALAVGLFSALILALPARADDGFGNAEVGGGVGYTSFDSNKTDEAGTALAVRGGYNFTKLFELEGQISDTSASDAGVDIGMNTYMVNAVFNFHPTNSIEPYVLGGLGYASLSADDGFGSVSDSSNAFQVAVGSRFFFGAKMQAGLRVEIASLAEDTFDESSIHNDLNVGFVWRFGR
jgi:opacity protein-like surface antigen